MTARPLRARCDVDIEQTPESFHAYAVPDGVAIEPGDVLLVHDLPPALAFRARQSSTCPATVQRAGPLARAWTRATAIFSLTSLYEVGFEPHEGVGRHGR